MPASSPRSPAPDGGEPADAVFAALADPTRRRVLRAVAEHGPVTATSLAGALPVTRQAVARHLGLLREAGLVAAERSGRETRFTARPEPLDGLAAWAAQAGRRWDDRLARLRRQVDGDGRPRAGPPGPARDVTECGTTPPDGLAGGRRT